ncbi:unnamed protein product [Vitrella brassicaformis CCMP3155]|uniref:Endonuclease/exonuclease/phosphatase domain-containing protein n=2 Tax=Vitrella brassicaformis TaxID=1169539 RepID=A0A0G4FZT1_VITBC|nr:unnamed protein product [Vitrella brassicaformis CCMP3155]|eukprot:CEM21147.1 unnamed protein product [Vitrella brassicaformis CCMP3155]
MGLLLSRRAQEPPNRRHSLLSRVWGLPAELFARTMRFLSLRGQQARIQRRMGEDTGAGAADVLQAGHGEISVLSQNLLADSYTRRNFNKNGIYRWVPREYLAWDYRWRRLRELAVSSGADVLCLQEVDLDKYDDEIAPFFEDNGYVGILQGNGKNRKRFPTANAVFYKPDRVEVLDVTSRSRAMLLALRLKTAGDGPLVLLANVHLEGDPAKSKERFQQCRSLIKQMHPLVGKLQPTLSESEASIIITGDFNSSPSSALFGLLRNGIMQKGAREPWQSGDECINDEEDFHSPYRFSNAYGATEQDCPPTYRSRRYIGPVDFVFHTNALEKVRVYRICEADMKDVRDWLLPNWKYGSDHLPVGAVFRVASERQTDGLSTEAVQSSLVQGS